MKTKNKKIIFKKNKILKEDAADVAMKAVSDIGKDIGNVFKVSANSFLMMWDSIVSQPIDIVLAWSKGESIRNVLKNHAEYGRRMYEKNNTLLDNMSGAKDLNSFIKISAPHIDLIDSVLKSSPNIGRKLEGKGDGFRKEWNNSIRLFYRKTGKGDPPAYILLDDGMNISPLSSEDKIKILKDVIQVFKKIYGDTTTKNFSTDGFSSVSSKEKNRLINDLLNRMDNLRKSKFKEISKNPDIVNLTDTFKNDSNYTVIISTIINNFILKNSIKNIDSSNEKTLSLFKAIISSIDIPMKDIIAVYDHDFIKDLNASLKKDLVNNDLKQQNISSTVNLLSKEITDAISKNDSKKDDEEEPKTDDKDSSDQKPINSSKKIIFKNKNFIIVEDNEKDESVPEEGKKNDDQSVEKFLIDYIDKSVSSKFYSLYFINCYFLAYETLLSNRISALYFDFVFKSVNMHKHFIEKQNLNDKNEILNNFNTLKSNYDKIKKDIDKLKEKLSDNIFNINKDISGLDSEISPNAYSSAINDLENYLNEVQNSIKKTLATYEDNFNKISNVKNDKKVEDNVFEKNKVLNVVKVFLKSTNSVTSKYNESKKTLQESFKYFEYDSFRNTIDEIKLDLNFYLNDVYTKTFITQDSVSFLDTGIKTILKDMFTNYNKNNVNDLLKFIQEETNKIENEITENFNTEKNKSPDTENSEPDDSKPDVKDTEAVDKETK